MSGEADGGEFHFSPRPNRASEIHWRPWSDDAFHQAQRDGRPILLSISAVWCHWCHVMDETTYSDPGVIDLVNREYVPIRVDNDVRPDINQRYNMGGWPTTAFLTPTGDILTGATYLPADKMQDAAVRVADYYRANRDEVEAKAEEGRQRAGETIAASVGALDPGLVDKVLSSVEQAYDPVNGGFGTSPKFPQTEAIALLAEQAARRDESRLMDMARHTLTSMAGGGTYDHVEGGFFRYSTTEDWSVPHFEKMLEDHAGLVEALALTGQADILDDAVRYLDTVLRDPETGLYAGSQDADEEYYAKDAAGRTGNVAPFVDRRVYAAWNAALAVAYLEASIRLDRPALRDRAAALLDRLFADLYRAETGMGHTSGVGGQLGDQVWALRAATLAWGAGLGDVWRDRALELAETLERDYGDPQRGGYFDRAGGQVLGRLGDRIKPLPENSLAAIGLATLDALLADPSSDLRERARRALTSIAALPTHFGSMGAVFARALDRVLVPPIKVSTGTGALAAAALQAYPGAVWERTVDARAIVCVGTSCLAPTSDPELIESTVREAASTRG